MANELVLDHPALSGDTLYALLYNDAGQVWDSVDTQFEAFTDAQLGQYDIPLTEQGTASGFFAASMPASVPAGMVWYSVRRQVGGTPAVTDPAVGSSSLRAWTGTAWLDFNAILADTNELQSDWANGGRLDLLLDQILADTGTDGVVLSSATLDAIATALLDLGSGVESSRTVRQALRVILAACAGKADGLGTTTVHYRNQADTLNRITATVDEDGNRSAITLDLG